VIHVATFRVFVQGDNFLVRIEGHSGKFGFYVTRFVDAADIVDARTRSLQELRNEIAEKAILLNEKSDAPELVVERIEEIDPSERPDADPGFVWFRKEE
jgi:hypothetical protein